MKVNVAQVQDATFKKFAWWSDWIDIAVFDFESTPFLMQMRVNRFNRKSFNVVRMTGAIVYRQATCAEIGDLIRMNEQAR